MRNPKIPGHNREHKRWVSSYVTAPSTSPSGRRTHAHRFMQHFFGAVVSEGGLWSVNRPTCCSERSFARSEAGRENPRATFHGVYSIHSREHGSNLEHVRVARASHGGFLAHFWSSGLSPSPDLTPYVLINHSNSVSDPADARVRRAEGGTQE